MFLAAFQNAPSVQDSIYPLSVKFAPVSIMVLKPDIANDQSDLEKKSALTLKDPHKVHKNGKIEIDNHKTINIEFIMIS